MKISIVCSRFPYPIEKGDKLRMYHQIRELSADYEIQLVSLTTKDIDEAHKAELLNYCKEIKIVKLNRFRQVFNLLRNAITDIPFQVAYFYDPLLKKEIQTTILGYKPDLIYTQLIRTTEYIKAIPGLKILDYMDAFSLNYERRIKKKSGIMKMIYKEEVKRLKEYEKDAYRYFDKHSIISVQDRDSLVIEGKNSIQIVKNGVDADFFTPKRAEKEFTLVFVGNMGYEPNQIAARFILDEIYPGIKAKRKDIKVLIAGARPDKSLLRFKSSDVEISGWLDDIRDAYNQGVIFIAPLFSGSGLQNKILEAMAMELPIITTSIVNGSIGIKSGDFIEANTADEFVEGILTLMDNQNLRAEMGRKGRVFVKEKYTWKATTEELKSLLEELYENS